MTKTKPKNQKQVYGKFLCRCENDTFDVLNHLQSTPFAGSLPDGTKYTTVVRKWVQCRQCGEKSRLMQWEFNPADWQE
jgi:hypothetical protein